MNNPQLIFDIGMHTGRDTEFYLRKGFSVVAVEANPALVQKGMVKFKTEIESGQLVIVNQAISNVFGTTEFFVFTNKDDWGSTRPDWNRSLDTNVTKITVETITLEALMEKHGTPYYMKIDIEGADILCLQSLLNTRERPTYLSIELLTPNNLGTDVDALDILCHLKALGYNRFLVSDQSKNNLVRCPQPALEGRYVDFSFDGTSSGLFGRELPGEWSGVDGIAMKYLDYFHRDKNVKITRSNSLVRKAKKLFYKPTNDLFHAQGWFDVHARIETDNANGAEAPAKTN